MSRGSIYIKPRQTEERSNCHEIADVALQALIHLLDFIQGAAFSEGKAENPEFRVWLSELAKLEKVPSFAQLCSTASTIFGVEQPKMLEILAKFESGRSKGPAKAYDKALDEIMTESNSGRTVVSGPLLSCYFDPSGTLAESDYRMGAPFYGLPLTRGTCEVVQWMGGHVTRFRDVDFKHFLASADEKARFYWFEATLADMLTRLPTACNPKVVWTTLKWTGITFSPGMQDAIIKLLKGDSSNFDNLKRNDYNWNFDEKLYNSAREGWALKWADCFAQELDKSFQGIVRYGRNECCTLNSRGRISSVEHWIQQNTFYCVHPGTTQFSGPHALFMRALTDCCRAGWYRDIGLALQRFRHFYSERQENLDTSLEGDLLSSTETFQRRVEKLKSDLKDLGLTFDRRVMNAIIESLTKATDDDDNLLPLRRHAFEVDSKLVSENAASHIRAALGWLAPRSSSSDERKRKWAASHHVKLS